MFNKSDLVHLAQEHSDVCVSIYLPTHQKGKEVLEEQDRLTFKNEIQHLRRILPNHGLAPSEVNSFLEPLVRLLDDKDFWHHLDQGLAIFRSHGLFKKYRLPMHLSRQTEISTEFYLLPLFEFLMYDDQYYLLGLSLKGTVLYQGTKYTLQDITPNALAKVHFNDVVGTDHQQKSLQFRTQHTAHGHASFHGHGEGKDDLKNEITKYFREINQVLNGILERDQTPLLVAGLNHLVPIYQTINTHPQLIEDFIFCNPKDHDLDWLHEAAWSKLSSQLDATNREVMEEFMDFSETPKAGRDIAPIVTAAMQGRVKALFIRKGNDVWGTYDPLSESIKIAGNRKAPNVSLINKAAVQSFARGGQVFVLSKEEMPDESLGMGAIYRY